MRIYYGKISNNRIFRKETSYVFSKQGNIFIGMTGSYDQNGEFFIFDNDFTFEGTMYKQTSNKMKAIAFDKSFKIKRIK